MTDYEPFLAQGPELTALQGQWYLVLRAKGRLAEAWDQVVREARTQLAELPVTYPARGHVTLGGVAGGAIETVRSVVTEICAATPALHVEAEGIGFFGPPFQILVVRIRKTPELLNVLTQFRAGARREGLRPFENVPREQWTFHMSVAYCRSVTVADWQSIVEFFGTRKVSAEAAVDSVELVGFDGGREYPGGVYTLRRAHSREPTVMGDQ